MRLRENGSTAGWTDAAIDIVRGGLIDGLSCSEIAWRLSERGYRTSRNAVTGIIHRRGLAALRPAAPAKPKAAPLPKVHRRKSHLSFNRIRELSAFAPDAAAEASTNPVRLLDLEPHHCRWPIGEPSHEMLHCGANNIDGHPYCAHHYRMAYRPASGREWRSTWRSAPPRAKEVVL